LQRRESTHWLILASSQRFRASRGPAGAYRMAIRHALHPGPHHF
jgi:hypothetical protein